MRRSIFLVLLLFLTNLFAAGQSYPFRHYTVQDGLVQTQITTLFQDSRGFIWIGTRNGLSRFDGLEFVNYSTRSGLPSNYILNISEDNSGKVHILTKEGLSLFDGIGFRYFPAPGHLGEFHSIIKHTEYDPSLGFMLTSFDSENRFVSYFRNGSYVIADKTVVSEAIGVTDSVFFNGEYRSVLQLFLNSGLFSSQSYNDFVSAGNFGFLSGKACYFFGPHYELYRTFDFVTLEQVPLKDTTITGGPFYSVEYIENNKLIFRGAGIKSELHWTQGRVNLVMKDRDNTVWFGTDEGLYRLQTIALQNFTESDGLARSIWSIAEGGDGMIFFASLDGVIQSYDGEAIKSFYSPQKKYGEAFYMGAKRLFDGNILFPTGTGVSIWTGGNLKPYSPARSQTEMVWQDPADTAIYLGTVEELVQILRNGTIKRYPEFRHDSLGWVSDMDRDDSGNLWIITNKRVAKLRGGEFSLIDSALTRSHWYSLKYAGGKIWIGGQAGLFVFDDKAGRFLDVLDGEINRSVNLLEMVNDSLLLAGRMTDLLLVDLKAFVRGDENFWRTIDKTDGYPGLESEQNAVLKDRDGKIWISTTGMVIKIDPDLLLTSDTKPMVYFTGYDIISKNSEDEVVVPFNIYDDIPENIRLSYKNNSLRIFLSVISTTNPEKVMIKYRFRDDRDWSAPVMGSRILLAGLKPGKYELELIAAGVDGLWSETTEVLSIQIVPAFWQTTLFIVMLAIVIPLLGGMAGYSFKSRRARRKRESEALIERIKTLQIQNIARQFDPHFTFNIISSVGSMIMIDEKEKAYDTLLRFSEILRGMLNDPGIILKPLGEELAMVNDYCMLQSHKMGEERFRYTMEIIDGADVSFLFPRMVIISFVENAIKHGIMPSINGGEVVISVSAEGDGLLVKIADNGIGRVAARERKTPGTGSGTRLTDTLFDYLNEGKSDKLTYHIEDLTNDTLEPSGTLVLIDIPARFRIS